MRCMDRPRWRARWLIVATRSLDGAKRNPGLVRHDRLAPDCASLHPGYRSNIRTRSSRCFLLDAIHPAARDIQEHLLQRRAVVTGHDGVGRVVVLDAAAFH